MLVEPITLRGIHVRLEPLSLTHLDKLSAVGLDANLWRWTTTQLRTRDDMLRYYRWRWMSKAVEAPFHLPPF